MAEDAKRKKEKKFLRIIMTVQVPMVEGADTVLEKMEKAGIDVVTMHAQAYSDVMVGPAARIKGAHRT